jgi:hypothetical protein
MTAPAGHVATTVLPVGADTHTVENSDGELARYALLDGERVALPARDGIKLAVMLRDALRDADGDTDGVTIVHWTYSRKFVKPPQPPPPDCVSTPLGVMEQEFRPRHDALTIAPLPAAPGHEPTANGPDGHDPVGLP